MTITINLQARHLAVLLAVAAAIVLTVWWASPAGSQTVAPDPVDSFAVVARADNPVDALAAAGVAGQLGAPVYLTFPDSLDEHARQGLVDTDPDVVVLAGGPVALSAQVAEQVAALLPDAQVRRIGGGGRTETARLLNELPGELGIVRPVLAGATVTGDVGIDGNLTVAGTDVVARLDALESLLEGATRTSVEGRDTLRFEAMNLQIVNGTGTTDGTPNGEGNLIIGYNAPRTNTGATTAADRAGSHYLIVSDEHHWTRFGGIVAGLRNTATGDWASVSGGIRNTASGLGGSVAGGQSNTAATDVASVAGGRGNTASGFGASVAGGQSNTSSGLSTSVAGGRAGTVSDDYDSRIGDTPFADS